MLFSSVTPPPRRPLPYQSAKAKMIFMVMNFIWYTILFWGYRAVRDVEDRRFLTTILVQMATIFYFMCSISVH